MKVQGDFRGASCTHGLRNASPEGKKTNAPESVKPQEKDHKALDAIRKKMEHYSRGTINEFPKKLWKKELPKQGPKPHPCTIPHKGPGIVCA